MSASPISLIAPAKLTLSLQVTGTRDDGYHLIDAEMVTLDIADVLTVTPGEQGLSFDGPQAQGLTDSDDNLVSRALRQCGKQARVHIQKNIPHGGGLGGGSADAAAIFRWANYQDWGKIEVIRCGVDDNFILKAIKGEIPFTRIV